MNAQWSLKQALRQQTHSAWSITETAIAEDGGEVLQQWGKATVHPSITAADLHLEYGIIINLHYGCPIKVVVL